MRIRDISKIFMAVFLVGISVLLRLSPHLPNVAPIAALALFAGAYLPKRWSWFVPIAAMLASDFFVGFYDPRLMAVVYGSFALNTVIGFGLRKQGGAAPTVTRSLAGSMLFFLTTNFAVWAFSDWYPNNLGGLMQSYIAALPFFRNSLIGDLFYTAVFFGGYAFVTDRVKHFVKHPELKKFAAKHSASWISKTDIL